MKRDYVRATGIILIFAFGIAFWVITIKAFMPKSPFTKYEFQTEFDIKHFMETYAPQKSGQELTQPSSQDHSILVE